MQHAYLVKSRIPRLDLFLRRSTRLQKPQPCAAQTTRLRPFTQNHPLLLVSRQHNLRPQLPYLSQPQGLRSAPLLQRQLARLLTTETKQYVGEQTRLALKWTGLGWAMFLLLSVAYYGWQSELVERQHPSPSEWSFYTRAAFRNAHAKLNPEFSKIGITDWAQVGTDFRHCVEKLEDPKVDGKDLRDIVDPEQEDAMTMIPGVGKSGYDITRKSHAWRTGYFQALMGCAKAAEHLDDMVRDRTRKLVFPKDVMIGPSNPDPRPAPPNMEAAPLEANCDRPYAPPETFYLRVLTGKGFFTAQKLDAALAYANWLEIKGAHDTATDVYQWALDVATAPVDLSDESTAASHITPNLLRANTALATHYARNGDLTSALPIYLSVLQARRSAPSQVSSDSASAKRSRSSNDQSEGFLSNIISFFIRTQHFPVEDDSGDLPISETIRPDPDCEEAEVMLYIGEILFATASSKPDEGLGWTKQAVDIARRGVMTEQGRRDVRASKCRECLTTGVANWGSMVAKLLAEDEKRKASIASPSRMASWFGGKGPEQKESVWREEARTVEKLKADLVRQGIVEQMALTGGTPGSVWVG